MKRSVNSYFIAILLAILIFIYLVILTLISYKLSNKQIKYESTWLHILYQKYENNVNKVGRLLITNLMDATGETGEAIENNLGIPGYQLVFSTLGVVSDKWGFKNKRAIDRDLLVIETKNDSDQWRVTKWQDAGSQQRNRKTQLLEEAVGTRFAGLFKALVFGEQSEIPQDIKQAFLDTGTLHIAALSGSNVSAWMLLVGIFVEKAQKRRLRAVLYALCIIFLTYSVQLSASIARATLMVLLKTGCWALRRPHNDFYCTTTTCLILLCVQPEWATDLGFILSFSCTYALLLFKLKIDKPMYLSGIIDALLVSSVCAIATVPIFLVVFQSINLNGIITTPLVSICTIVFSLFGLCAFLLLYYFSFIWWRGAVTILYVIFYLPLSVTERVLFILQKYSFLRWNPSSQLAIAFCTVFVFVLCIYAYRRYKVFVQKSDGFVI